MKRWCFGLMLAALAGGAAAGWERVGAGDGEMAVYADRDGIQKSGDTVKMWALIDYKAVQNSDAGKPYQSAKLLHEYDCKDERARSIYYSLHAGPMAAGNLLESEVRRDTEWYPAGRTAIGEALWKFACGKQ